MTTADLKRIIAEKTLHPIFVTSVSEEDSSVPRFEGTLDEFWLATKALGATAIFIYVSRFEDADFSRPPPDDLPYDGDDEENSDAVQEGTPVIDLEKQLPPISKFRKHIGKECAFVLSTKGGVADLEMLIQVDWWTEFLLEADKAVEAWTDKQNERRGRLEAESQEQQKELLKTLKGLIEDRAFCVLATQRAMKTYALDKFPELDDLPEDTLKIEIQALHDKIQTRGLKLDASSLLQDRKPSAFGVASSPFRRDRQSTRSRRGPKSLCGIQTSPEVRRYHALAKRAKHLAFSWCPCDKYNLSTCRFRSHQINLASAAIKSETIPCRRYLFCSSVGKDKKLPIKPRQFGQPHRQTIVSGSSAMHVL